MSRGIELARAWEELVMDDKYNKLGAAASGTDLLGSVSSHLHHGS